MKNLAHLLTLEYTSRGIVEIFFVNVLNLHKDKMSNRQGVIQMR